jgi:hypothetical protein
LWCVRLTQRAMKDRIRGYERVHAAGPEFGEDNWLANHAPMAAEVLARRGRRNGLPTDTRDTSCPMRLPGTDN